MNLRILFFCFRKVFPPCFLLCLSTLPLWCNVILDHCYFSFCFPGRNFLTKFDLQVDARIHQNCLQNRGLGKQHRSCWSQTEIWKDALVKKWVGIVRIPDNLNQGHHILEPSILICQSRTVQSFLLTSFSVLQEQVGHTGGFLPNTPCYNMLWNCHFVCGGIQH